MWVRSKRELLLFAYREGDRERERTSKRKYPVPIRQNAASTK